MIHQIDCRYAPSERQRWWPVLHDEGDMVSEPLYGAAFRDYLSTVEPIPCRCFERVLLLGDYHPAPANRSYPLVEVPVNLD